MIGSSLCQGAPNLVDELEQTLAAFYTTWKPKPFGVAIEHHPVLEQRDVRLVRRAVDPEYSHRYSFALTLVREAGPAWVKGRG
jgi:hypothetical protein